MRDEAAAEAGAQHLKALGLSAGHWHVLCALGSAFKLKVIDLDACVALLPSREAGPPAGR